MKKGKHFVSCPNGATIYCEMYRAGDGCPTIVLSNGSAFHRMQWLLFLHFGLIARLHERFNILLYDYEGTGLSSALKNGWNIRRCADNLNAVLDHFGIDKAHHYGISQGTIVIQSHYIYYPDRVRSLCGYGWLYSGYAQPENVAPRFRQRIEEFRHFSDVWENPLDWKLYKKVWQQVYRRVVFQKDAAAMNLYDWMRDGLFRKLSYLAMAPTPLKNIYDWFGYGIEGLVTEVSGYRTAMEKLPPVPMLFQHAINDQVLPFAMSQELHKAFPHSTFIEYPAGYSHISANTSILKAARIAKDYCGFINRISME